MARPQSRSGRLPSWSCHNSSERHTLPPRPLRELRRTVPPSCPRPHRLHRSWPVATVKEPAPIDGGHRGPASTGLARNASLNPLARSQATGGPKQSRRTWQAGLSTATHPSVPKPVGRDAPTARARRGDATTAHSSCASRCTCPMNHAATEAVTDPTTAIPPTMRATATNRPRSPYPTVITVVAAHNRASPNVVMFAPEASR